MQKYVFLLFSCILFLASCTNEDKQPPVTLQHTQDHRCSTEFIESDIRGTSMLPLYQEGDTITYASGYYRCHDVKRDDIVIFNHGNDQFIIKRVVGIPGDTWQYQSGKIIMNSIPLKNSEGNEYQIQSKMLTVYAESYPIIPKDTYMILGNRIDGTLDSSKFGLIAKQDIIGKVDTTKKKR